MPSEILDTVPSAMESTHTRRLTHLEALAADAAEQARLADAARAGDKQARATLLCHGEMLPEPSADP